VRVRVRVRVRWCVHGREFGIEVATFMRKMTLGLKSEKCCSIHFFSSEQMRTVILS
jgi:hypothetical protein